MEGQVNAYRQAGTMGKSQLDLIIQVYDGAISHYQKAKEHFIKGEETAGREKLEKGQKFIVHLYTTLDSERGGEIGENLGKIYSFIVSMTDVVVATKDIGQIDDIIDILSNLRDGWTGLKSQEQKPTITQPTENERETAADFIASA